MTVPLVRKPATSSEARAESAHAGLMREMKSKRGYDPIPPAQHEWQLTEGLPANVVRFWSWLCAHTVRARMVRNEAVRTAYATLDDGVTPATLAHFAKETKMDIGQASKIQASARLLGICHGDGKTPRIYLNGEVTAAQVLEANKKRKLDCTVNLTPSELLKINKLPKTQRDAFWARWEAAQVYGAALERAAIAEVRETRAALDSSILRAVGIEKKRIGRRSAPPPEPPPLLAEIVQSMTVQPTPADCTHGENEGENVTVHAAASLLSSEKYYREDLSVAAPAESEDSESSTTTPLEPESLLLANLLQIPEHTAGQLLERVCEVEPSITWLETACLARRFNEHASNARNPVGLLLARLHTHAKGATLERARQEARELAARHPEKYRTAGGGQ
jgi:hypothetical protein